MTESNQSGPIAADARLMMLLTVAIPEPHLSALRAIDPHRVEIVDGSRYFAPKAPAGSLSAEAAAERDALLQRADILYNYDRTVPDLFSVERTPRLRWIQSAAASVHPLRRMGGFDRGAPVTNMGGVSVIPSSEWAFGTMLDHARQTHRLWANTRDRRYERFDSDELYGKTVVICALGRVGRRIARYCRAFDMRVWGTRRRPDTFEGATGPDAVAHRVFTRAELPEVLPEADYLVLSLPNTPETRHYIGAAELALLKPSAYLVNIGRGSTLDYTALIAALHAGKLAGAAVDVFQDDIQPLPTDDPLWAAPNILIAPHTAAQTGRPDRQAAVVAENLRRFLAGERLINLIDPALGY